MSYDCVVLAKQVPDTKAVTGEAMNEDGTVNRSALPSIFNPEDLNALEMALQIRGRYGGTVTVITMGPPSASEILRQSLCRGADRVILITDMRSAASDTLATSYILSCAVRKLGTYDLILCGRQAIDGDTGQVGPQAAEKLGLAQITYVEELLELAGGTITVRRSIGNGWEKVQGQLPVLMTVIGGANDPRPAGARRMMRYKKARTPIELKGADNETVAKLRDAELLIEQWGLDDLQADLQWCGRNGSPTKVHRIQSVVLTATDRKDIEPTDEGMRQMVHELIEDHTIG